VQKASQNKFIKNFKMTAKPTIESVLVRAFDYNKALKSINRSKDEISQLRKLVDNEKWIPRCVTDKHVSFLFDLEILRSFAHMRSLLTCWKLRYEVFKNKKYLKLPKQKRRKTNRIKFDLNLARFC
jgi:hypothetical protein